MILLVVNFSFVATNASVLNEKQIQLIISRNLSNQKSNSKLIISRNFLKFKIH